MATLIVTNNVKIKENDETTLEIEVINPDVKEGRKTNKSILIDNNYEIKKIVLDYEWIINDGKYAYTRIGSKSVYMHQLIFEHCFGYDFVPKEKDKKVIDHLNNNRYDNRLRNLHILTKKDNSNKKLIDIEIDNLTVYVEYNYNENISQVKHNSEEIYNKRKYVLSYISQNIIFHTNKEPKKFFNCFELVYNDYYKFIADAKEISLRTKKNVIKENRNKKIEDIQFEFQELQKAKIIIENILNAKKYVEIRNKKCNILTKEEFNKLSESEKRLLLTLNKTVLQYLPTDSGGSFKL